MGSGVEIDDIVNIFDFFRFELKASLKRLFIFILFIYFIVAKGVNIFTRTQWLASSSCTNLRAFSIIHYPVSGQYQYLV